MGSSSVYYFISIYYNENHPFDTHHKQIMGQGTFIGKVKVRMRGKTFSVRVVIHMRVWKARKNKEIRNHSASRLCSGRIST